MKSYRDLPIRLAEFGSAIATSRQTLQGIMRVRGFVQDDAHIFCRDDQIHEEVLDFITVITSVYQDFGFDDIIIKLSTRPEKRVGSDEVWDRAEQALANALDDKALEWEELPGEGAFYGPKSFQRTVWAAFGSAAPFRLISPHRTVWMPSMLRKTALDRSR